jgi:hypothetical protein
MWQNGVNRFLLPIIQGNKGLYTGRHGFRQWGSKGRFPPKLKRLSDKDARQNKSLESAFDPIKSGQALVDSPQDQACIRPAEAERIAQYGIDLLLLRGVRHKIDRSIDGRVIEIDRGGRDVVLDRER